MDNPIVTIETAIVNRLTYHSTTDEAKYRWPFSCKYIDSYGGQFESAEEINQAAHKAPGLWVAYEGESGRLEDNGEHIATINYAVFGLVKSYSPAQLRKGGKNVAGLYQLIEAVRLALVNQTLGKDMTPLEMTGVTPLWRGGPQGGGVSLALIRFSTEVRIAIESNFELDEKICPTTLYDVSWEKDERPLAASEWRVNHDDHISETEGGGQGDEP